MSATLLQIGLPSTVALIRLIVEQSDDSLLLWYVPSVLALPLAFLLFTSNVWTYRLALAYLAFMAQVFLVNTLFLPMFGRKPPASLEASLLAIIVYSFPCVVALMEAFRRRRSNQTLESTAGHSVESL